MAKNPVYRGKGAIRVLGFKSNVGEEAFRLRLRWRSKGIAAT